MLVATGRRLAGTRRGLVRTASRLARTTRGLVGTARGLVRATRGLVRTARGRLIRATSRLVRPGLGAVCLPGEEGVRVPGLGGAFAGSRRRNVAARLVNITV